MSARGSRGSPASTSTGARPPSAATRTSSAASTRSASSRRRTGLNEPRRTLWNLQGKSRGGAAFTKGTRWPLLTDPAALTESQRGALALLAKLTSPLHRGYLPKEQLPALYRPESQAHAPVPLEWQEDPVVSNEAVERSRVLGERLRRALRAAT